MESKKFAVVKVPATTANFGPAYDVMGMALDVWLELRVEEADEFSMDIQGQGSDVITADKDNMIVQSVKHIYDFQGQEMPNLKFTIKSDIPFGCGCGSSSAAVVAGLMAGLILTDSRLPALEGEGLLQLATKIEGHPDNAAPAIYGGNQMSFFSEERFWTQRVPMPLNLNFVMFVPTKKMKANTNATRNMLPTEISIKDAVHNMARTAVMAVAFTTNDLGVLRHCVDERMHQNPRESLFPHMNPCIQAAMNSGAVYSFLSGAGPTICAVVPGRAGDPAIQNTSEHAVEAVSQAVLEAAKAKGVEGTIIVTQTAHRGAFVVDSHKLTSTPQPQKTM